MAAELIFCSSIYWADALAQTTSNLMSERSMEPMRASSFSYTASSTRASSLARPVCDRWPAKQEPWVSPLVWDSNANMLLECCLSWRSASTISAAILAYRTLSSSRCYFSVSVPGLSFWIISSKSSYAEVPIVVKKCFQSVPQIHLLSSNDIKSLSSSLRST